MDQRFYFIMYPQKHSDVELHMTEFLLDVFQNLPTQSDNVMACDIRDNVVCHVTLHSGEKVMSMKGMSTS